MNRQQVTNCNACQRPNHIARFCPDQTCAKCNIRGHHARDCPLQYELRQFTLWFPFNANIRMGINRLPMREFPGIGQNLQRMQNAEVTTMNGNRFFVGYSALHINYGGRGSIVIAMQDEATDAETLITIRVVRHENAQVPKIKVAAKYTIMCGQLIEDIDRLATGSRQQQSPQGDVHVLLYIRDMLSMTPALEINGAKFYIDWNVHYANARYLRAEVSVSTQHSYSDRLANRDRELIENGWAYFRGVPGPGRPIPPVEIAEEIVPPKEAIANEDNLLAIEEPGVVDVEVLAAAIANERDELAIAEQPDGENQRENAEEQAAVAMDPEIAAFIEERFAIEMAESDDSMSESSDTDTLEIVTDDELSQNNE